MEESKEATASASTSAAAKPNSEVTNNSSRSREEGELSSSDDDELPAASESQITSRTATHAKSIPVPPANKDIQSVKAGKSISTNTPANSADVPIRTSVKPNSHKSFEKSRGQFVPFLISFSDDESGSESEESRQGKSSETRGNSLGGNRDRRPLASSLDKSQIFRPTIRNETKVIPRKVSLGRTCVSSMTNINAGPLLPGKRYQVRNFKTINKNFTGREHGGNQNVQVSTSKLQDLRQQIAIRETELKLKSAQQSKETVFGSCSDQNLMNLNNVTARKHRGTSTDFVQSNPKEPDKKRLKVSGPHSSEQISGVRQEMPVVKAALASEKTVLEHSVQRITNDHSCHDIEMHSNIAQWQNQHDRDPVLSGNVLSGVKNGTDINTGSQSERNTKLADPLVLTEQTKRGANRNVKNIPNKSSMKEFKHSQSNGHHVPSPVINKATCGHNLTKSKEFHEFGSGGKTLKSASDNRHKGCSLHVLDSNFERSDASLNDGSLWNFGNANILGDSNMDMESVLDIEELQDNELEEAQEHRRKCEVEERNALKAYRKAQRALIEANARCSHLYQKRELCSAHFRSLIVEGSGLFGTSRLHSHNVSDHNVHLIPTSSNQMGFEFDGYNHRYGSNLQSDGRALQNGSDEHVNEQNLVSDPCSPYASTSEPHKDKGERNGVHSPSSDLDTSADEAEETFPSDYNRSVQSNLDRRREEEIHEENNDPKIKFPLDGSQDSLLLEASLRSQLFARLGMRTMSKERGPSHSRESAIEPGNKNDDGGEKMDMSSVNFPFSKDEKGLHSELGGTDIVERSISELPIQIHNSSHVEKSSSSYPSLSAADALHSCFSVEHFQSTKSSTFSGPILRSAVGHIKVAGPITIDGIQARNREIHAYDIYNKKRIGVSPDEIQPSILSSESKVEIGPYACNLPIDPVWPLCMYELRGKCNNDECSWQHVRDYSGKNMNQDGSDSTDTQVVSPSNGGNHGAAISSKCLNTVLAPPTYLVSLDILKADSHAYESVPAISIKQCWRKCFSAYLVLSSLVPTYFPSDEPFLHGSEARMEVQGSWNRQSLYFHSRNGKMSQLGQCKADTDKSLEMALLNLSQDVNKHRGRIEALKVLARALEGDPTSVVLWIVYMHVYYSSEKSIGKDDMFSCAIEQNGGSYELWLMYINSRLELNDRLVAYDTALSMLCRHTASSDRDTVHDSSCILDLFLQMMNCLCISGNYSNAIEKTNGLFATTKSSDNHTLLLLSDILPCLTISDKCIFWICCVYLVVYRKLPDAVVQRFECKKELPCIEWPSVHLTVDDKQQAVKLMELAVDSLALHIDSESLEIENTLKGAHLFALNHVRCISVLEGPECSMNLLDKYTKLYPSSLELVLMSARAQAQAHDCENTGFLGFEEALSNWPEEVPGAHCIWNQYAECALQSGRFDFAKELMDRWFDSVWRSRYSENVVVDDMDCENSFSTLDLDHWISNSTQIDVMFGLLNFSLRKLLQNDRIEGRLAIDKALKVAVAEDYKHCVREHAMLLLTNGSQSKAAPIIVNILKGYLVDPRSFAASEPLSRSFIHSIKKPRVRQLVGNLWGPLSSNFSLVNLVLEVWYGQSLLPKKISRLKDLVDLVEALLEIMPANYKLAISVCQLLSKGSEYAELTSPSVSFWASSLLVNTLFQAVPVAPEYVWVEAASVVLDLTDFKSISESFHKRALSVYPFSLKLWESYLKLSITTGNEDGVIEAAKERGIKI